MAADNKYTGENLIKAIKRKEIEEVRDILIHEPALADTKENGVWAVMLAALTGDLELLQYIVEYSRANLDVVDEKNRSVLHYGVMSGEPDVVRYLVGRVGLSPETGDFDLITPFEMASDSTCMEGRYNNKAIKEYFEELLGYKIEESYKNPIRSGCFPDPSIVRVNEDYYMANSSFIYFPCIPISHSVDLVNWEIIGYAITDPKWAALDELEGGRGYWAPDISYHNGEFYVTATYRMNDGGCVYRKQIIVHSKKPEGPYSEPAVIDEDGIDPSLFWEDDGSCYMLLNRGARILQLDSAAQKQISPAKLLYYGSSKRASEGPHILKKDGWYYLFEAEGGTGIGHRETVSRSKTLMGNYEPCPYNPILRQEDDNAGIRRCGHGKPVSTPDGEWYMVYLCGRMIYTKDGFGMTVLGRETCLDKITWTKDGWPLVNNRKGPSSIAALPYRNTRQKRIKSFTDEFDGETIKKDWIFPRPPMEDAVKCENKSLKLLASPKPLSDVHARNVMLIRQTSFCFTAKAVIVPCQGENRRLGITCYYDENSYIIFYYQNGALHLCSHIGRDDFYEKELQLPEEYDTIELVTVGNYADRSFYYRGNKTAGTQTQESFDDKYIKAYSMENVTHLCDEGVKLGKRFTGAMTGIFVYGDGESFYGIFEAFSYKEGINGQEDWK